MPGSPPSNRTEPGTNPPPTTLSNSAIPVVMRGATGAFVSLRLEKPKTRPFRAPWAARAPIPEVALSSAIVFHPPQESQRPCQRWLAAPQFWQTKEMWGLAMLGPQLGNLRMKVREPVLPELSASDIIEPGPEDALEQGECRHFPHHNLEDVYDSRCNSRK